MSSTRPQRGATLNYTPTVPRIVTSPTTASFATVAARLLVPAWIVVLAGLKMADGSTDALPVWLNGIAVRSGWSPLVTLRILLGMELLAAGLMLVVGSWARAIAIASMVAACFSAIASISAAPEQRGVIALNAIVFVVSAVLLATVLRGKKHVAGQSEQAGHAGHAGNAGHAALARHADPADAVGPGLSVQWQIIAALAITVISAIVAAQLPIRVMDPSGPSLRLKRPADAVDLNFAKYVEKPLTESGVQKYLPALNAATMEGRHIVVFYNPACGVCHDLFREYFSGPLKTPVIAVLVPAPPEFRHAESDQPEDIDCPNCERMALREGLTYLITPPTLVLVEDGIITCVAVRGPGDCLVESPTETVTTPEPGE